MKVGPESKQTHFSMSEVLPDHPKKPKCYNAAKRPADPSISDQSRQMIPSTSSVHKQRVLVQLEDLARFCAVAAVANVVLKG